MRVLVFGPRLKLAWTGRDSSRYRLDKAEVDMDWPTLKSTWTDLLRISKCYPASTSGSRKVFLDDAIEIMRLLPLPHSCGPN
ncbi:hypothetical protein BHE74_00044855 [Ensete ventricosum]|nr:hypothetical protein BHE74_00044855 [Ensete ventricosum]RZS17885.1 hypothetical protein BHM03_00050090 [Ensete ventricosum]